MTFTETGTTPSHHNEAVIYAQCLTIAMRLYKAEPFADRSTVLGPGKWHGYRRQLNAGALPFRRVGESVAAELRIGRQGDDFFSQTRTSITDVGFMAWPFVVVAADEPVAASLHGEGARAG
jgi:hypothetical protein